MIEMSKSFSRGFLVLFFLLALNVISFSADKFLIQIQVGGRTFNATLIDNPSTRVLVKKFPMAIVMNDLYSNEKYFCSLDSLPTKQERIGNIKTGDIFLYGTDCLVIFYENFKTSYSYTKLGQIDNPSGLKEVLGAGSEQVNWSLASQ